MKSFRSEIENPIVEKDILELEKKIQLFHNGKIDEEKFRSLRLARGVYGQRQTGVQMIRIKIPYGKLNARQLLRICDVTDEYSRGKLHFTTRQDIQIHYVSLDRTPELWAELEKDEITLREACGNTVRNIVASELSGIDPEEPFDPRPYTQAVFEYFLRNPICQEMGRKFKMSFSNNGESDTGLAFMHDLGFIAKTRVLYGEEEKGFQVWMGGGLGSQSMNAHLYENFVPTEKIIPIAEATLRVFERYGERSKRMKARLKFLIKGLGFEAFRKLVDEELKVLTDHPIPFTPFEKAALPEQYTDLQTAPQNDASFESWKKENVIKQKDGLYAIGLKIRLGDISTEKSRVLAEIVKQYSGDEITITINQNLLLRHFEEKVLWTVFQKLQTLELVDEGYNSFLDVTACPGTDTCNLGIASSTGLSVALEEKLLETYKQFALSKDINIKISGCMNACGQHMISTIGFQGMTIRTKDKRILPATQVLIGGAVLGNGQGRFADRVIKLPSKRTVKALEYILEDFQANGNDDDFISYYDRQGKIYFYDLLKPLADMESIQESDFLDWGSEEKYEKAIGIGECAGVVIDLVSTLLLESEEKLMLAQEALADGAHRDSIYHSYAANVNTAKALLTAEGVKTNAHITIINNFQEHFVDTGIIKLDKDFADMTLRLKSEAVSEKLAAESAKESLDFFKSVDKYRKASVTA